MKKRLETDEQICEVAANIARQVFEQVYAQSGYPPELAWLVLQLATEDAERAVNYSDTQAALSAGRPDLVGRDMAKVRARLESCRLVQRKNHQETQEHLSKHLGNLLPGQG